jgi:hypothetical protein
MEKTWSEQCQSDTSHCCQATKKGSRTMVRRVLLLVLTGLALLVGAATGAAATTGTLQAPTCNGGTWMYHSGWVFMPTYNGDVNCELREQDFNNWGVVALQNTLGKCYGQFVKIDGDFGTETRKALQNAQRWERITVDGVYGPVTREAITWPTYNVTGDLNATHRCRYR